MFVLINKASNGVLFVGDLPHTFCYLLVCTFYGIIRGDKNCSYEYILHHLAQQSYVTSSVIAHYTTSCSNSEQLRQLYFLLYTTVAVCLYNSCLPRNHSTVIQTGKRGGGCLYTFIRIYIHTFFGLDHAAKHCQCIFLAKWRGWYNDLWQLTTHKKMG